MGVDVQFEGEVDSDGVYVSSTGLDAALVRLIPTGPGERLGLGVKLLRFSPFCTEGLRSRAGSHFPIAPTFSASLIPRVRPDIDIDMVGIEGIENPESFSLNEALRWWWVGDEPPARWSKSMAVKEGSPGKSRWELAVALGGSAVATVGVDVDVDVEVDDAGIGMGLVRSEPVRHPRIGASSSNIGVS